MFSLAAGGCDDGWRMADDVMWRGQYVGECLSFVELWTLRWQQVASVFGVCLGERCGLWLDVASVRLGVAVKVGRKHECCVREWRLRF